MVSILKLQMRKRLPTVVCNQFIKQFGGIAVISTNKLG